ncbi:3-isopropylmalate dehydratase small subunit (plasmid) [Buchnera aphidicola (Thelaxes californica)]|uniref:3-isopropylmalate dehydratase small subunit n=1 Tax=Buchnera aphidicola (Thelaxes californica) TaxID=1315998 RepID=A0A4D6YAI1_9GAMM|nr:3-isopropylmalate dehydratase small subunit [Buchnera aphidicola]QCI27006.1 3-isopropylmalate dehydratase small subunit [Buchnera aphidicola (Thelaxes californica)]
MNITSIYKGFLLPLNISDIDTDAIIPKEFLQKVTKKGFGKHLFNNWKYIDCDNKILNPDFNLNKECYKNATVLLTRNNFGCGSSREHAVWALLDYGIKVIIASSYSDIFYTNSFNNQLLLITLNIAIIDSIFLLLKKKETLEVIINLIENYIIIHNKKYYFSLSNFHRLCILNGLDEIDFTLQHLNEIKNYESTIPKFFSYKK